VSSLRYSLISEERDPGQLGRSLGVLALCLLVSVWIHLLAFIAWQLTDKEAASAFHFYLENDRPPIELNLVMNQPPPALEVGALENSPPAQAESGGTKGDPTASEPTAEELEDLAALAAAQAPPPPELAQEDMADSELLPQEGQAPGELNPDPPISLENDAPERRSYFTLITRAIKGRWIMPPEAKNQFRPGRFTADVTIARDGTLLRSVVIESTGNAILDHAAHEAVRSAAPFPAFPEELKKFSQLEIRMHFDYQAQYRPSKKNPI